MSQEQLSDELLAKHEELKAAVPGMNMFQDLFARAVFSDNDACEHILRILTGNQTLIVKENYIQHLISKLTTHNIIMDVLVEDANHKLYEVEIQKAVSGIAHEKRMLYYASSIINDYFFKGDQSYTKVPELYVFYVSETDIWNKGKTCYPVLKHLGNLDTPYDDGLHMCYINAEVNDNSDIAKLMQYFKTADPKDNSQGRLSKRIQTIKNPKEDFDIMDDLLQEYCDIAKKIAIEEGRAEGEAKGRAEGEAKGKAIGRAEGKAEGESIGEAKATFNALKNIMQSFNVSIDKAMDALHTPEADRQHYKDLLAKAL